MKIFKDRVAVITGAASGIGRGLAEKCVEEGMRVVLADINQAALDQAVSDLTTEASKPLAVITDVSRAEHIENLADQTLAEFGAVHLLFNNAGIEVRGTVWEQTQKDWEWIMNVNLWSVIYGIRTFVPIMLKQATDCHIVNTASGGALISGAGMGSYRVTKAAVFAVTETLHYEMKQQNAPIGVSVLYPSFVQSNLINAEKYRPDVYKNPSGNAPLSDKDQEMLKAFEKMNREAISPLEYAEMVFEGIREEKLYLRTHPRINQMIEERTHAILNGSL